MKNNRKFLIIFAIIALLLGIIGGVGGEIFIRTYLLQDMYKVPLFGNIDVPKNIYGGSNLIIESPKKVIVEQNTKVLETVNSVRKNMVGIFDKIIINNKQGFNKNYIATSSPRLKNYYNLNNPIAQGFAITSDGWIMSTYVPNDLSIIRKTKASSTLLKLKSKLINKYVIVDSDAKVYDLLDVKLDDSQSVSFWKINAKDLNVRQFANISKINKGELVIATNFQGKTYLNTISEKYAQKLPLIFSSDKTYSEISLASPLPSVFQTGFLFNINGDLIAFIDYKKAIIPVSSYFSCLSCLLNKQSISRPYLGLNYINLDNFSSPYSSKLLGHGAMIYADDRGIAVIKNSPADIAGLKEGDIITAVNTIKLDNNNTLSDLISGFRPGENLNFIIERNGEELQIKLVLSVLK